MQNRNLSSISLSRHWLPCSVSLLAIGLLSACGGGSGVSTSNPAPTPGTFNLLAARQAWLAKPLNEPVTVSGSFSGSATFSTTAITNGPCCGQSSAKYYGEGIGADNNFQTLFDVYYDPQLAILAIQQAPDFNVLFTGPTPEFDLAQNPITLPAITSVGDTGEATLLRYTDATESVSLGTRAMSWKTLANAGDVSGQTCLFQVTFINADGSGTEVDTYIITATGAGSTIQSITTSQMPQGNLTITAQ
jgi:hypothetical protein